MDERMKLLVLEGYKYLECGYSLSSSLDNEDIEEIIEWIANLIKEDKI